MKVGVITNLQQLGLHLLGEQFRGVFEILTKSVGQSSQSHRREEIDGKTCVSCIVSRKQACY